MEGQNQKPEIDYKSLLARYIQVVSEVEGVHFINECSTKPATGQVWFTPQEKKELYRLFDEFE